MEGSNPVIAVLQALRTRIAELLRFYNALAGSYRQIARKRKFVEAENKLRESLSRINLALSTGSVDKETVQQISSALEEGYSLLEEVVKEATTSRALALRLSQVEKATEVKAKTLLSSLEGAHKFLVKVYKRGVPRFRLPIPQEAKTIGAYLLHEMGLPFVIAAKPIIPLARKIYRGIKGFFEWREYKAFAKQLGAEKVHPLFKMSVGEYIRRRMEGGHDVLSTFKFPGSKGGVSETAGVSKASTIDGLYEFFNKKAFKARWTKAVYLMLRRLVTGKGAIPGIGMAAAGGFSLKDFILGNLGVRSLASLGRKLLPFLGKGLLFLFSRVLPVVGAAWLGWKIGTWLRKKFNLDKYLTPVFEKIWLGIFWLRDKLVKVGKFIKDKVVKVIGFFKDMAVVLKDILKLDKFIGFLKDLISKVKTFVKKHVSVEKAKVKELGKGMEEDWKAFARGFGDVYPASVQRVPQVKVSVPSPTLKVATLEEAFRRAHKDYTREILKMGNDLKSSVDNLGKKLESLLSRRESPVYYYGESKVYSVNDPLIETLAAGKLGEE